MYIAYKNTLVLHLGNILIGFNRSFVDLYLNSIHRVHEVGIEARAPPLPTPYLLPNIIPKLTRPTNYMNFTS